MLFRSREYAEVYSEGKILVEWFHELGQELLSIYDNLATAQPPEPAEDIFEMAEGTPVPFTKGSATNYKEITVISGKGGTGKTTVVGSLAHLAENKILADNDVDAADLHLLLTPTIREEHDFVGGTKAIVDPEKCTGCGKCAVECPENALMLKKI